MKLTKLLIAIAILTLTNAPLHAQKMSVQKGKIKFFSEAPLENITAISNDAIGIIDLTKMDFAFSVKMQSFKFEKSLMEEHFNEKYVESEKYPRATFTGTLQNFNPSAKGPQAVVAVGKFTIHGVTKDVSVPGTIEIDNKKNLHVNAKFMIKLEDYNIERPTLVWQSLAEEVEVTTDFVFEQKAM